jgi:hypothetical protein
MRTKLSMVSAIVLLVMAAFVMGLATPIWANVYASELVKTGAMSFSYTLNENAGTNVQIQVWKVGGPLVYFQNLGSQASGVHSWTWDGTGGASNQSYKVKVYASDVGHGTWTQINVDDATATSFYYPMGVSVYKSQDSAKFGKICISEGMGSAGDGGSTTHVGRSTTSGIYILNADATQSGFATGGVDWSASSWYAPYKSCIGPDDHLYVSDTTNDYAWEFNDDLSVATLLIGDSNKTANQYIGGISVTGTGANRKVATVNWNSADNARKGIVEYSIPAGQVATPGYTGTQIIPQSYYGSWYYPQDVARDSAGGWYVCTDRYTYGQFPAVSKFANGVPPLTTAVWEVPSGDYNGAFGIDIYEPKGWVAYANVYTGYIQIFNTSDGSYVGGFVAGTTPRDVAFDAAGNLVTIDNDSEWARIWSPGDGANSFTTESYFTFDTTATHVPSYALSNKAVTDPIMTAASGHFKFTLWGKVTAPITADSFYIDDGSGMPVKVNFAGHSFTDVDYVSATGTLDVSGASPVLNALVVKKQN